MFGSKYQAFLYSIAHIRGSGKAQTKDSQFSRCIVGVGFKLSIGRFTQQWAMQIFVE